MSAGFREVFGYHENSLARIRDFVGLGGRASVWEIKSRYESDIVLSARLVTDDGVPLGGEHKVTLKRVGEAVYQGYFRATGAWSYDVSLSTSVGYRVDPAGAPAARQLVFVEHGRVSGTNEVGSRRHSWNRIEPQPIIAADWHNLKRGATLHRNLKHDVDLFGSAGGLLSFIAQLGAVNLALGGMGVGIFLGLKSAEALGLERLTVHGIPGLILSGGAAYLLGPGYLLPVFWGAGALTAATLRTEELQTADRQVAMSVFKDKLTLGDIIKTNMLGWENRPFTIPVGGKTLLNLGEGWHDSASYTGGGSDKSGNRRPGQLLVHELVHAWQIEHESFVPEFYCRAIATQIFEGSKAYEYGITGAAWSQFGTEQQAAIVDQWFAGNLDRRVLPDGTRKSQQYLNPPQQEDNSSPYYRYIRDNIRTGVIS